MIATEDYLTPTDLRPVVANLVKQLADWDKVEQTWVVGIPVPLVIHTQCDLSVSCFDDLMQWHEWSIQNGLHYSSTLPDTTKDVLSIVGIYQ